jgi:hypothetical protein
VLFRVVALYAALYAWCVVMLVASVYFFFLVFMQAFMCEVG